MSDTTANTNAPTDMATQSETSHWCKFSDTWPYPQICDTCGGEAPMPCDSDTCSSGDEEEPKTDDPVIGETSTNKKVYAAVRSTPFVEKASKKEKVVKPKKPNKAPKKAVKENDFYNKLFEVFPLSLPTSPPFSDGQINEFQCQHCGIHKELDDETWYACPYAIFHGLVKSGGGQLGDQEFSF